MQCWSVPVPGCLSLRDLLIAENGLFVTSKILSQSTVFATCMPGGFYPFITLEEYWAYWSRYIYINRYQDVPKPVYDDLLDLLQGKAYFVLTSNVDHCFQKAGFDKQRIVLYAGGLRFVAMFQTLPSKDL